MTMKRTDEHAPSRIKPNDYEFIGFDYYGPAVGVETDQREIHAHQRETGGDYSEHAHGGTCMVCGALAFYVAVFYYPKTNVYITVGQECANKMELSTGASGDWNAFKKAARASIEAHAGKQLAFKQLCEKGLQTAWYMWTADYYDLPVDETRPIKDYDNDSDKIIGYHLLNECVTVRDMVSKLVRYGSMTEKAEGFLRTLLTRIAKYPEMMAARKAEKEAAADCPTGRVTVEGIILKLAQHESQFGTVTKMTVKDTSGFLVWTTVPTGMDAQRGATVKFTVTVTPSDRDVKFGFGKCPKVWVSPEEKAAEKIARKERKAREDKMRALGCWDYSSPNYGKSLEAVMAEPRQHQVAEHGDTIAEAL